jgi:hypothetical protein
MISSRPEGLPKSPRPRLFKPEWASNVLLAVLTSLEKKNTLHMVRRAHSSCAPNRIWFGLTLVDYGGHKSLWKQSAKLTADSIGYEEIADFSWLCQIYSGPKRGPQYTQAGINI